MSPFEKFYSDNLENFDVFNMSPKQRLRAAFEAGQASVKVLTAYQVQAAISKEISEFDAETRAITKRIESIPDVSRFECLIVEGRHRYIQHYRELLSLLIDVIARLEKESEA